ncbi:MAG: SufE family protein [Xanthomonadales bacterium]|nr:SufE family protein [Xanthomonadales bacterium]MCE7932755.1 SufE family protein [Xanthomonadales bacterium PRO6]
MDPRQQDIVDEFALFGDWSERYQYLIDLGKRLPAMPETDRIDAWRVTGCQSTVWLKPAGDAACMEFAAMSDSAIVGGLLALVLRVYSGRPAAEIVAIEPGFIEDIGLSGHLSPTRKNGLAAVLAKIRGHARAALS